MCVQSTASTAINWLWWTMLSAKNTIFACRCVYFNVVNKMTNKQFCILIHYFSTIGHHVKNYNFYSVLTHFNKMFLEEMCLFNIAKQGKNAVMCLKKRQNKTKLQSIMGSNKRMYLNDKWLILFFSVSVPKQRKPHEKHKAAGGREMQQYPVLTGSDLSSGSGARDARRKSNCCSRPLLLYHNAAMFHKKRVLYETR